jgi:alpha-galactosidase
VLALSSSFYALRLDSDGRVLHLGSGAVPLGCAPTGLDNLAAYDEPDYAFDVQRLRYELPCFGDLSYHDVALKVTFPELADAPANGDSDILPIRDLRLRYVDHSVETKATPGFSPQHGRPLTNSTTRETLAIRLKDVAYDFWATLFYRVTPECDVIERWLEIENKCAFPVNIETLAFGTVHLPNGKYDLTRIAGAWAREFDTVKQPLEQGKFVLDHQGLTTGHPSNPIYMLAERGAATEQTGEVHFGALAYSGNWSLRFETLTSSATRVHGGYETTDFGMTLQPGESHRTPGFIHGVSADGVGGASRRLHRFVRDYILPGFGPDDFRPVLYNSWEATYFDLSAESQIAIARKAAAIGVELYCVDDGWFGSRRNDRAGLGDWTVSADVFPDGLKPLIDEVKALGMRFGLWVEPEMVNPDSDLYRAHPEWALHFPGRPRTEGRQQLILDLGRPEVVEYIFNLLDTLVRENDISFFKWDMNRYASEPGSVAGKGIYRAHVAGVYSIMDRLRATHPHLDIQSCSGGGGRVDLGILGRTDQVWTSDNTDPVDRVFIEDGFSLAYPARAMESWVTHEVNHQTGRRTSLDLRFDVAMRGALGIGTPLDKLSDDELDAYKRKIAFYKLIRPIVQGGDLYRLRIEPGVSIWQTVLADGSRAVLSTVIVEGQRLGQFSSPTRLKGLTPEATYIISDESGAERDRYTGYQLATLGLPDGRGWDKRRSTLSETLLLTRD